MINSNLTGRQIGIYDFQEGILSGKYSDAKGYAFLVINNQISNTYIVHIDRRIVSNSNSIVSFAGLLKEHGPERLSVFYEEKEVKFPDLDEYAFYKNHIKNDKKNNFGPVNYPDLRLTP